MVDESPAHESPESPTDGSPARSAVTDLAAASYVALTSYRRDGTPVATPVWVVGDGDALAVWTPRSTYKVKRIRRDPAVTVAPCTFRGEPLGPAVAGRAEVMSDTDSDRVRSLIKRKYGVMGWLTVTGSRLRRGATGTVGIRVDLAPGASSEGASGEGASGGSGGGATANTEGAQPDG
jgi:PPOX class probable F420-dependent enzyme